MRAVFDSIQIAIADCGYWGWWTANLPSSFQVEFGRVHFYERSADDSQPPSGTYALRFIEPQVVEFLEFASGAEKDWYARLHADELDPLNLDSDAFYLGDLAHVEKLRRKAIRSHVQFRSEDDDSAVCLAFRAGRDMGLFVAAKSVKLLSHQGEIPLRAASRRHQAWWAYWKRYGKFRSTSNALPYDGSCEICIPAAE